MIPRLKLTFPHNWSCRVALHTNELNEEENLLATGGQEKYRYTEGEKERKEGRFRRVNKCKWVKLRQKKSRKSSNTKAMRFWSVTACCKEIKAGGIKWLKRAGATWVFTFFLFFSSFLYSRENEQRENERAARTEHQCTLPLSSLTTSMGGLGYCEFGVKYFKGVLEWRLGWARRLGSVWEMKHTCSQLFLSLVKILSPTDGNIMFFKYVCQRQTFGFLMKVRWAFFFFPCSS